MRDDGHFSHDEGMTEPEFGASENIRSFAEPAIQEYMDIVRSNREMDLRM